MRRSAIFLGLTGLLLCLPLAAEAAVLAKVSLSQQRMEVYVNGAVIHSWPVSTARRGKRTPTGSFRPQSLKRHHRSTLYNGAPMPYSIFFHGNYAIHGSHDIKNLGRPASAGCVRLHPNNAATLYSLVQRYGPRNTRIQIVR
jgi:lipoprotein-anchoring transpeptidase ErfK/SrfK